jgi:hypothetical protein
MKEYLRGAALSVLRKIEHMKRSKEKRDHQVRVVVRRPMDDAALLAKQARGGPRSSSKY